MPNIVTHIAITPKAVPYATEKAVYGSVVPDLAGMYRDFNDRNFRLDDEELSPDIRFGKMLHTETDKAFDDLPETKQLVGILSADLQSEEGRLSRGAVRALSQVGTDILLDGEVMKSEEVADLFLRIRRSVLAGKFMIRKNLAKSPVDDTAEEYFKGGLPERYQDPEFVAELMHKRLASRGSASLTFDRSETEYVAYMFERQAERLKKAAGLLVEKTVEQVYAF